MKSCSCSLRREGAQRRSCAAARDCSDCASQPHGRAVQVGESTGCTSCTASRHAGAPSALPSTPSSTQYCHFAPSRHICWTCTWSTCAHLYLSNLHTAAACAGVPCLTSLECAAGRDQAQAQACETEVDRMSLADCVIVSSRSHCGWYDARCAQRCPSWT
jgi:hypothetical protein